MSETKRTDKNENSGEYRRMDFESSNRLNVLVNALSGNLLPIRGDDRTPSIGWRIYRAFSWSMDAIYMCACVAGIFGVSREKALRDGTVNIIVGTEIILVSLHMHRRGDALRTLIGNLNDLLEREGPESRRIVEKTTVPLERPLAVYVVAAITSVMTWTAIPLVKIFQQEQFGYEDYRIPAVIGKEPISASVFVLGIVIEVLGAGYTISKKIGLDLYMIHTILLLSAQYEYLRYGFAMTLRDKDDRLKAITSADDDRSTVERFGKLIRHHSVVVQIATKLRSLLSLNIGIVYVNSVLRFCFLGFMIVTTPLKEFQQLLVLMYAAGALTQVFILCHCVQRLLDASRRFADDAFHERWYAHELSLRRSFAAIIVANKLECRLSAAGTVDLTLPSFMTILNQAYSVCLLFLRIK